jgi:hypothetical protein
MMSRRDAAVLAGRTLALLLTVWALSELSSLPGQVHSFLHYLNREPSSSATVQYYRHYYLLSSGFLFTRIVGFFLMARWLFKVGPGLEELLLPPEGERVVVRADSQDDEQSDIR